MLVSGTVVIEIMFLLFLHMKRCFMFGNMVFHKLEGKPYLDTRTQFRKLHPNSNTDFSKAFLSNGVFSMLGSTKGWYFQGMITPRTVLIRQSPATPASRALISPRWCLSTNCGSSAPKNSRPSRPATATAREKEKAKADLQKWVQQSKHVNEMTLGYPLMTSDFSDLLVLSTNLKLVYHAILIFCLKLRVGFGGKAQLGKYKARASHYNLLCLKRGNRLYSVQNMDFYWPQWSWPWPLQSSKYYCNTSWAATQN